MAAQSEAHAIIAIAATLYFLPSIFAVLRRKSSWLAIWALNLFAGWTLAGWFGAFIWSLAADPQRGQIAYPLPRKGVR